MALGEQYVLVQIKIKDTCRETEMVSSTPSLSFLCVSALSSLDVDPSAKKLSLRYHAPAGETSPPFPPHNSCHGAPAINGTADEN